MPQKADFVENVTLYPSATDVKVGENLGFTIVKGYQKGAETIYKIQNAKGDFEITKIVSASLFKNIQYSNPGKTFSISENDGRNLKFYITANIEADENEPMLIKSEPVSPTIPDVSTPRKECRPQYEDTLDITLIASDGTKIPSHRCTVEKCSSILGQIFKKESEFIFNDFNAGTIKAAVHFMYGKNDAINGKEMEVFKFAAKYGIHKLINECCSRFEKFVDPSNVCEYIQIAYAYNFKSFKDKCLKIMVENGKKFDNDQINTLPHKILVDIVLFYQKIY